MKVIVDLEISKDEMMRYYQGEAYSVVVTARNGKKIQFPANILRPFLTRAGVSGAFEINYNNSGKLENIRKIS